MWTSVYITQGLYFYEVVSFMDFLSGSVVQNSSANEEDSSSIPGSEDPRSKKWQPTTVFPA